MQATAAMDERIERKPLGRFTRRQAVLIAAGVAAIVIAVFVVQRSAGTLRVSRAGVTIAPAVMRMFNDTTVLNGTAIPRDTIVLDALEGGRVEEVYAKPGDHVLKGQPLVRFSNTQLELDILAQEGRLIESITQLQAYRQQLERERDENARTLAQIDYDRTRVSRALDRRKPLAERGFIRREEMDQLSDELVSIDQLQTIQRGKSDRDAGLRVRQLPQIEAQLNVLQASLTITRGKLDALVVRAPASGQFSGNELTVGESRGRGDRLGEIILDNGYRVRAEIDEFYLDRVRLGQQARLEGDEGRLVVSRINPQVQQGRFTIDLEFAGGRPGGIVAGQSLRGTLTLGRDRRALVLPAGAFLASGNGQSAFVLDAGGTAATRRTIRIGRRNSRQVEVLEGIKPDERVIVSSYEGWSDIRRITLED